jgi:hypothetical protein
MPLTEQQEAWMKIPAEQRVSIIQQAIKTAIANAVTKYEEDQKSKESSSKEND